MSKYERETFPSREHYLKAMLCCFLLYLLDHAYVYGWFGSQFLFTAESKFLFLVQSVSLVFLVAPALALFAGTMDTINSKLEKREGYRNPLLGATVQALLLLLLGLLLVNNGSGRVFRVAPATHWLLPVAMGGGYFMGSRALSRRISKPVEFNTSSILSAALNATVLLLLYQSYLSGHFGLSSKKAVMATGVSCSLFFSVATWLPLFSQRSVLQRKKRIRMSIWLTALALLISTYVANIRMYVDDYAAFHLVLTIFSGTLAWLLAEAAIPETRAIARLAIGKRGAIIMLGLGALGLGVSSGPRTVSGYVGTNYTVYSRAALGMGYKSGDGLALIKKAGYLIQKRLSNRKDRGLYPRDAKKMPSTCVELEYTKSSMRPRAKSAVIFFLDKKRPRDLGISGPPNSNALRIDRILPDAFVFKGCFSASNYTLESFPAFYTGTYPGTAMRTRDAPRMSRGSGQEMPVNLPGVFRHDGYQTVVLTNDYYFKAFFQGEKNRGIFGGFERIIRQKSTEKTLTANLLKAYQESGGVIPESGKYLAVIHLQEHEIDRESLKEIGDFIDTIIEEVKRDGRWEDTVLIVTADHGMQFREHGRTTYGHTLFNEEVNVPLIIRVPGLKGGLIRDNISSVDLLATLVDLLNIRAGIKTEGRSFLRVFYGDKMPAQREIYFQSWTSTAILRGKMKMIKWFFYGPLSLFDLDKDPGEVRNVVGEEAYRDVAADLENDLLKFEAEHRL
jgi:hypothetical protein